MGRPYRGTGRVRGLGKKRQGAAMRKATIERKTNETEIRVELAVDGKGRSEVETGIGFLDHLLDLIAVHGLFDLKVSAK